MRRFICTLLIFSMIIPCVIAESSKELPKPDENGRITYTGEVGWQFDEKGNFIKESIFDEAVLCLEEIPGVSDACIIVENGKYLKQMTIAIVVNGSPSVQDAKELADSALRQVGLLFGLLDEYEAPNKDSFGTIYDDYVALIGIFTRSGKEICHGAITRSWGHITW